MPILIYLAIVIVLFIKDRKIRPMASGGLWIVLAWLIVIGTKPVSAWLGTDVGDSTIESYAEGDPTLGYTSVLHDGARHLYFGFNRHVSEFYAALTARY